MQTAEGGDPPDAPVGAYDAIFQLGIHARLRGLFCAETDPLAILRMDPAEDMVEGKFLARSQSMPVLRTVGEPYHAACDIQHPQDGPRGRYRVAQPRLAFPQRLVGSFAGDRAGEDLADHLKPFHERFRPLPFFPDRGERHHAHDDPSRHQRDHNGGTGAVEAVGLTVAGGFRREIRRFRDGDRLPPHDFFRRPRKRVYPRKAAGERFPLRSRILVEVGQRCDASVRFGDLPHGPAVEAEGSADAAQRVLDLVFHLLGRQIDEAGGDLGQQHFERELLLDFRTQDRFFLGHLLTIPPLQDTGNRRPAAAPGNRGSARDS